MATRRRVPRAEREQQMLQAALRVFAEHGFHSASMDDIAAEVGVTKPMLYAYFGSKEGLYRAAIERGRLLLMETIALPGARPASPDEQLWNAIVSFFHFVGDNRDAWALLYREASARGGEFAAELARGRSELVGLIERMLEQSVESADVPKPPPGSIEPLAHAILGAGESLANWWLDNPGDSVEVVSLRLMNFAWMGLAELRKGRLWLPPERA